MWPFYGHGILQSEKKFSPATWILLFQKLTDMDDWAGMSDENVDDDDDSDAPGADSGKLRSLTY